MGDIESITRHLVDGLQTARDIFDHFVAHLKSRVVLDEFEDTLRPKLAAVEAHRIQARDGLTDPVVAMLVQGRVNAGDFQQVMVFDKACQTHHNAACVLLARFTECFIVDGPHEFYTQNKGTYDCYTLPVWINSILFPDIEAHYAYPDSEPSYYFAVWERLRAFPMQQVDNLRAAVVIEAAATRVQPNETPFPDMKAKLLRFAKYIQEHPAATYDGIEADLNMSRSTIGKYFRELATLGVARQRDDGGWGLLPQYQK